MEMGGTKPVSEHAWIQQLVGNWKFKTTMMMPDGSSMETEGTEDVEDFGGLWSFGVGKSSMPDGSAMEYKTGLGYDVSFKGYRAFMIMNVSSHLWKYEGTLSEDGKKMTLDCVGPDMMSDDGGTANYRDFIEIIDENHRTLTSTGQAPDGSWMTFMTSTYERV